MNILLFIGLGEQELLLLLMILSIFLFKQKSAGKSLSPFGFVTTTNVGKMNPTNLPFTLKELTLDKAVFYLVLLYLMYFVLQMISLIYERVIGTEINQLTNMAYKALNIVGDLLIIWVVLSFWYIKWRRILIILSILALLRTLYYTFQ